MIDLIGRTQAGISGQCRQGRFGMQAKAVGRPRVPFADVGVANGQIDAG